MLKSACLGTNDLTRAARFYDAVLAPLALVRIFETETEVGFGPDGGAPCLYVVKPYDGRPATWGNGTQMIFKAMSPEAVDAFHAAALGEGGLDEGAPGPRDYAPGYYGAYCRDPDGNKLHAAYQPE